MRIKQLNLAHLRCVTAASLDLGSGINLITGENGAGKTTAIEALHLLSHGRSFRGRVRDGLIQHGARALHVRVHWEDAHAHEHRAGLEHDGKHWRARVDGDAVKSLAELASHVAMVCFEPGSHALLSGAAENRRRFVDWSLFHVEPGFLDCWRRYARALRQRNSLLKTTRDLASLDAWETELQHCGDRIAEMRSAYLSRWHSVLLELTQQFLPELAPAEVSFVRGWRSEDSLADALRSSRERDQIQGFTSVGPHRADWRMRFGKLTAREGLSRGQTKLAALACVLAQAQQFAVVRGYWPLVCLDDLASELDQRHQQRVLAQLLASKAQVVITATEDTATDKILALAGLQITRFHVEQGTFTALL